VPNDPRTVVKRRNIELKAVRDKVWARITERGWALPKTILDSFMKQLESALTLIHSRSTPSWYCSQLENFRKKLNDTETVLRKTDKSKVFHLGKTEDYRLKAQAYMTKTRAYERLDGQVNPLVSLVERTNHLLHELWSGKHISQNQYEKLKVDPNETQLAHLYFLPKAHKPGTPL
jgi:hypothetical protein